MNIPTIGTASAYAKNVALRMKWNERKENPLKSKGDEDPMVKQLRDQAEQQRKTNRLANLHGKLQSGMKLTKDEMEYLKTHSPEEYERAVKALKEREQYKKELANCRSKEDVERLRQQRLQQFCTEAKAIANNPNIPADKKKEKLEELGMRAAAVANEHIEYTKKAEYQNLPETDEEAGREGKRIKNSSISLEV